MTLTLRDVVARRTPLDWFESVALVQGVCAASLLSAREDSPRIPGLESIVLTQDGLVGFAEPGPPDPAPVGRALGLLETLLADADPPSALRMMVATGLPTTRHYGSLGELSDALEYYERPDRRAVLAAVYERAVRLPEPVAPASEGPVARAVPGRVGESPVAPALGGRVGDSRTAAAVPAGVGGQAEPVVPVSLPALGENWEDEFISEADVSTGASWEALAARARARAQNNWASAVKMRLADWLTPARGIQSSPQPRRLVVGTAALLVLMLAGGMWWLWPKTAESGPATSEFAPLRSRAVGATAFAAAPAIVQPALRLAASTPGADPAVEGRRSFAPGADDAGAPAAVPATARSGRNHPSPAETGRANSSAVASAAASQPSPPSSARAAAHAGPRPQLPVDEVIYLGLDADDPGRPTPTGPVYSATDPGVRPPVGIQPRFWYEPPDGMRREELTQVEVLVSARGDVLTAKAVAGPRSYFDGMVLSAIKTWRFQPATRNGLPVAYRMRVFVKIG